MSQTLPSPLPAFDRRLLRSLSRVVPSEERAEWSRSWEAELWHVQHRHRRPPRVQSLLTITDLSIGVLRDALWLRTESWRRAFSGTALLCLASLFSFAVIASLVSLYLIGSCVALQSYLHEHFMRCAYAAPLVVFVAFATASRRHLQQRSTGHHLHRVKRQFFLSIKIVQVLLLAFLLSADIALPLHAAAPNSSEFLQIMSFVICSLVGMRWSITDQEGRCKQCLHALDTPARVGRPSSNLLEWNGTELTCKHGHGLLRVPEMETSWCQSSRWVVMDPGWEPFAGA
jgi:hypothetical protein